MKTLQQFLNDLGIRESGGNYRAFNRYGYAGKYQMGETALVDAGYYRKISRKYNNDWSGDFLGKDGVYSIQDFLMNPRAQENAQIIFKKKTTHTESAVWVVILKKIRTGRRPYRFRHQRQRGGKRGQRQYRASWRWYRPWGTGTWRRRTPECRGWSASNRWERPSWWDRRTGTGGS